MAGAAVTAPRTWWPRSTGPGAVLLASGLLGALAGAFAFPTWQVAVETAQVIAGLVRYPPDNPFYTYHTKLWTILHQLCAGLLLAGVSERVVSVLLSGLLGMLSLQAVSMVVYALSRQALVAVAAGLVVLVSRAAEHGPLYPISLVGTPHTYGAVGLSAAALAIGLLGAGCWRSGTFLLGLLPAIHPSIGIWVALIVALAALPELRRTDSPLRAGLPYAAGGAALTALSLLLHVSVTLDLPDVDAGTAARYFRAFVAFWDGHRYPLDLAQAGVSLNRSALILALVWMGIGRDRLRRPAVLLLRIVAASGVVSLFCMVLSWIPPAYVPVTLLQLMPARVLNVNIFLLPPLLIGLLHTVTPSRWTNGAKVLVVAALLANANGMLWDGLQLADRGWWESRLGSWVVCEFAALVVLTVGLRSFRPRHEGAVSRAAVADTAPWLSRAAALVPVAAMVVSLAAIWREPAPEPLDDRTTHPFWAEVARDPGGGLTATAGTSFLVQLYTRRPVLINTGALDTLSYAPESGPALDRLLRDVYDLDLFNPPDTIRAGSGSLSFEFNKESWERFSRERWIAIRREHNVTQVLAYAAYALDLPIAAETPSHKLYRIPEE